MQRRSRLDITKDMLQSLVNANGRLRVTRLMYKANLSHPQMKGYLEEFLEKNLIEETREGRSAVIEITVKGRALLQKIHEMHEFEQSFGL